MPPTKPKVTKPKPKVTKPKPKVAKSKVKPGDGVDPCAPLEAVQRALSMVNNGGQYILGTGNYRANVDPDVPWTTKGGKSGADCAGFAMAWCYRITRARKGFNKGSWATVSDDINTDSGVEDAAHKQELYRFVDGEKPEIGDLIVFPSKFDKKGKRLVPGHVGIITSVADVAWTPGWASYGELDVAQCKGKNFRKPGVLATSGQLWADHDAKVKAKEPHRVTRILRVNR